MEGQWLLWNIYFAPLSERPPSLYNRLQPQGALITIELIVTELNGANTQASASSDKSKIK